MRFFLIGKKPRQQFLFCAHCAHHWWERWHFGPSQSLHPSTWKIAVNYCKLVKLAVLCVQMLLCRLLLSAETFAESTQEMKINRPIGRRIFIKPVPIFLVLWGFVCSNKSCNYGVWVTVTSSSCLPHPCPGDPSPVAGTVEGVMHLLQYYCISQPAISLYLCWLRALKQCCSWECPVGQSWSGEGHGIPPSPQSWVCSCPRSDAHHEAGTPCTPCQVAYLTEGQGPRLALSRINWEIL